jgi:putative spermidine/putrescine transport system substrate-binding protein
VSLPALLAACGGDDAGGGAASTGGTSGDVVFDGKPFDAGGATLNVGNWGGFWQDFQTRVAIKPFEKQYNCKIKYDSAAPFYPKMAVAGEGNPPLDVYSFDQDTDFQNKAFIATHDQIKANSPAAADLWPFAFDVSGTAWSFSEMVYGYRKDLVDKKPEGFGSIFDAQFDGKRGMYIPENAIGIRLLIVANMAFGSGQTDWDAGLKKLKEAGPWKVTDFTGTMQGLLEQGEVVIAPIDEAELFALQQKDVPVEKVSWADVTRPIVPQQFGVAKNSKQLRLAYAFLNWMLSNDVQSAWAGEQFWLPTNKNVELPALLTDAGFGNDADATDGLDALAPAWESWFQNSSMLVDELNKVFQA